MQRFVLLRPRGDPTPFDVDEIRRMPGVVVLDSEIPRAMLVEADKDGVAQLRQRFPEIHIAPDVTYPLPGTS